MAAIYVYGIIPFGDGLIFDIAGMNDDEIYTVVCDDMAAVVGVSPLADYRGLKREEAVRYLLAHQQVVEAVMQEFPILPVKFGTVLPDESRVHHLLVQGADLFRAALETFAGRVQVEIVVLWDIQEVFQEIGEELRSNVAAFQRSDATMADRIAIGRMVQAALECRRAALRERILPPLREVALDVVVNPPMDDSMVANVALLCHGGGGAAGLRGDGSGAAPAGRGTRVGRQVVLQPPAPGGVGRGK